jgi:hypothetical protein
MPASAPTPEEPRDLEEARLVRLERLRLANLRLLEECEGRLDRLERLLEGRGILAEPRPQLEVVKGGD